ncbi:hypothetical protein MUG60_11880 [Kaistella montana]|nr:hypothetical protein [Kaistella montana]
MPRPLAPLATSLPAILTVPEGREAGLSRARLRAPDVVPVGHGLRMSRGVEASWTDYLRAIQSLNPSGVFSHATAARIWGMWIPGRLLEDPRVHLAKERGRGGRTSRSGLVMHQLQPDAPVIEYRGLRLTAPAWTWVDLAHHLSVEDLVVAGDSLLPSPHGAEARRLGHVSARATTVDEMRRLAHARKNVRGIVRARAVLDLLRTGADSPPESRLRHRLHDAGFPEPQVNPPIRLSSGETVRVDLAWEELRLCLEFDGDQHRTDRAQWQRDRARRRGLEADDWAVTWVAGEVFTRGGWPRFVGDLSRLMRRQATRRGAVLPPGLPGE